MKNKTIAILLTAILAISITACGNKSADDVNRPADTTEQSGDLESFPEDSAGDSKEETTGENVEEPGEESGEEQSTGDGVSKAENVKSFAYIMDDGWWEPWYRDFQTLADDICQTALGLSLMSDETHDKIDDVMSNIIQR